MKIIILLYKNYEKNFCQFFNNYFVNENELVDLEEYDSEVNNNITEKLNEKFESYKFLNSIIFLNELVNLHFEFKKDEIMENTISNLITKYISKINELLKGLKINDL